MKFFLVFFQCVFFVKAFSSYPIATGERDLQRLQILKELYNPSSEIDEIMTGLYETENNPLILPQYCEARQIVIRRPLEGVQ
jgi:hypothetical protein